jgi:ribonuclease E
MRTQVDRMSDSQQDKPSDKRDRWKMIASLLGAAVPEEPVEANAPEAAATESSSQETLPASDKSARSPAEHSKVKPAQPARAPSDWNALCGQLGIEVSPIPDAKEEPLPPATVWQKPIEWSPPRAPAPSSDESVERDPALSFFDPDAALEVDTVDAELDVPPASEAEIDVAAVTEELDSEAADDRSTFASGDATTGRRRRRRRRRRGGAAEREETADADELSATDSRVDDEDESDESPVSAEDEDAGEEREESPSSDRGRRPRRRRRRPALREEVRADSETEADDTVDETEEKEEDEEEDIDVDDYDDDDEEDDDEVESSIRHGRGGSRSASGDETRRGGEGTGRGKHKKIPTWEEAMAVIVSANMESRRRDGNTGKSRPRGPRRRGRGPNDRR